METKIKRIDGNGKPYYSEMPKIHILDEINDVALNHIKENTGLNFKSSGFGYVATPKQYKQVLVLLMTYNFKTQYHDNATNHNILYLKFCSDEAFKINSICRKCAINNNIVNATQLKKSDILGV